MHFKKDLAKFLSGFLVHDILTHLFLAGSGFLPFQILGINFTPEFNTIMIIIWSIVTVGLVYYAWFAKK
ncbi:MAG TPA: hypothetical protein VLG50_00170 [Candidatus Saccharimonadales bacterium]|nr:hypothetical protein [Candidatus Saccharimonadales bacterium]